MVLSRQLRHFMFSEGTRENRVQEEGKRLQKVYYFYAGVRPINFGEED